MCQNFRKHLLERGYSDKDIGSTYTAKKTREVLLQKARLNLSKYKTNQTESTDGILPPGVRFPLTYNQDTAYQMHNIKQALNMSKLCSTNLLARVILGDGPHPDLCISNAMNLRKILVSTRLENDDTNDNILVEELYF